MQPFRKCHLQILRALYAGQVGSDVVAIDRQDHGEKSASKSLMIDDEDEDVICIRTETEIPKDMNVNFELEKDSNDSMSLLSRKEKNKIIKEQERITSRFDPHILKTQFTPMPRKYATTMKKIEEEAKKKNKKNKN